MCIIPIFHFSAISPDGLLCQCREHKAWHGCRSTHGVDSGKHYYEATVTDEGLCRVGWSTPWGTLELGNWVPYEKRIITTSGPIQCVMLRPRDEASPVV